MASKSNLKLKEIDEVPEHANVRHIGDAVVNRRLNELTETTGKASKLRKSMAEDLLSGAVSPIQIGKWLKQTPDKKAALHVIQAIRTAMRSLTKDSPDGVMTLKTHEKTGDLYLGEAVPRGTKAESSTSKSAKEGQVAKVERPTFGAIREMFKQYAMAKETTPVQAREAAESFVALFRELKLI